MTQRLLSDRILLLVLALWADTSKQFGRDTGLNMNDQHHIDSRVTLLHIYTQHNIVIFLLNSTI